jgi:uncharacterized protein YlxW (UPF0749 family)
MSDQDVGQEAEAKEAGPATEPETPEPEALEPEAPEPETPEPEALESEAPVQRAGSADPAAVETTAVEATARRPWRRLSGASYPPAARAQLLAAVLVASLGFALVAQLNQDQSQRLSGLRQSDLVQILDDIGDRRDRLAAEQSDLEAEQRELATGATDSESAIRAARDRLDTLGVLAGTVAAQGTGVEVFISDQKSTVGAAKVLDLVQELRDAGAEAIQVGSSRVVATTAFTDASGGVGVDGVIQRAPYTVLAIGDGQTMATALQIPGGVVDSLPDGSRGTVAVKEDVQITALRPVPRPRYARPAASAAPTR